MKRIKETYLQIKTVLSLGGGGEGSTPFPIVASSEAARVCFAQSARQTIDTFGLDGIDSKMELANIVCSLLTLRVDWEHPTNGTQGNDYIRMLELLRQELPAPRYLLTSALPAGEWALRNINLHKASLSLDLINLMTYDFSGPWTAFCGHQSQLYSPSKPHDDAARISCDSAVTNLLNQGVAAHKILLGIPAYGRSFLRVKTVGDRYVGHAGDEGTFEYRDLPRPGATIQYDNEVQAVFCIGGDGGFVSFDDPKTVRAKAVYAKQKGLGGLFYWTGTGDRNDSGSLVESGYRVLHPS